jgi:hypothetical protein
LVFGAVKSGPVSLNWYRNIDRGWKLTGFLDGAKIPQPVSFIAGEKDAVRASNRTLILYTRSAKPASPTSKTSRARAGA